eukprot:TRINITY_DN21128_c0_g2_i1.p1 TRINITY_DN21128_c0_g2~~TRINITY_DN21128_c0_g2_i1.p1  ORF type:complete len:667 (+),score=142.25 TRINITY_DN21128_c0_g2_i1:291-2291(+)
MTQTHYEVLGISRQASGHELRVAFKRRALALHPDKGGSKEAFQSALCAFEVLSDENSRREYDRNLPPAACWRETVTWRYRQRWAARRQKEVAPKRSAATPAAPLKRPAAGKRHAAMRDGVTQRIRETPRPQMAKNVILPRPRARKSLAAAKQREDKVLSKVFLLLQRLPSQRRRQLLQEQLTQPQRLALEAWALSVPRSRPGDCGGFSKQRERSSPQSEMQPRPSVKPSSTKSLCDVLEAEPLSSSQASESVEEMPENIGPAMPVPGGAISVRGIASKLRRQRVLYQANVCVETLYMVAREVPDLCVALDALVVLTAVRQRVVADGTGSGSFEERVQAAVPAVLEEHGYAAEELGLRFQVMMSMRFWVRPPLHTPHQHRLEDALKAWKRLAPFRPPYGEGARGLSRLDLEELKDRWLAFREVYLDILEEGGRSRAVIAQRLDALDEAARPFRERRIERWNRLAMQEEDRPRHRSKRAALAFERAERVRASRAARAEAAAQKKAAALHRKTRRRSEQPRASSTKPGNADCKVTSKMRTSQERLQRRLHCLLARWERSHCITCRLQAVQLKAFTREIERQAKKQVQAAEASWRCQRAAAAADQQAEQAAKRKRRHEHMERWRKMNHKDLTMEDLLCSGKYSEAAGDYHGVRQASFSHFCSQKAPRHVL